MRCELIVESIVVEGGLCISFGPLTFTVKSRSRVPHALQQLFALIFSIDVNINSVIRNIAETRKNTANKLTLETFCMRREYVKCMRNAKWGWGWCSFCVILIEASTFNKFHSYKFLFSVSSQHRSLCSQAYQFHANIIPSVTTNPPSPQKQAHLALSSAHALALEIHSFARVLLMFVYAAVLRLHTT